jgi:hypothetical protein
VRNRNKIKARESWTAQSKEEDFVKVPKSEYEAFKTRLHSIETTISQEFNAVKLDAIKVEMGKNSTQLSVEQVENKFHETLMETNNLENTDKKTDQLAKRLSRELKIRPSADCSIMRSPSARKIGSLRRRRDSSTRLSRNQSWHLGTSSSSAIASTTTGQLAKSKKDEPICVTTSLSFYPKPNIKRPQIELSDVEKQEKFIPEKPVRKSVNHNYNAIQTNGAEHSWTPATEFFNDNKFETMIDDIDRDNVKCHNDNDNGDDLLIFKTPVRPSKKENNVHMDIDLNNTPMLPPRITPAKRNTPISERKTPSLHKSMPSTPSVSGDSREARASIIQIRNQNAGMVAQKAKLFDDLSGDTIMKSADRAIVKLPRVPINKPLESLKNENKSYVQKSGGNINSNNNKNKQVPYANSPRRSSRSPGINRRVQLRLATQSPVLKTIRERNEKGVKGKLNMLKENNLLNEISSPRKLQRQHNDNTNNRRALSQNNTPRKTPSSAKKGNRTRNTPSKSPRISRRNTSFD